MRSNDGRAVSGMLSIDESHSNFMRRRWIDLSRPVGDERTRWTSGPIREGQIAYSLTAIVSQSKLPATVGSRVTPRFLSGLRLILGSHKALATKLFAKANTYAEALRCNTQE